MKIWFLTFEIFPYFGGGLASYMNQVLKMYDGTHNEVFVFARDPQLTKRVAEEEYSSNIKIIRFRGGIEPYYKDLGYWPAIANEFAQHVASFACRFGSPDVIEAADGFGIGSICLQKKLTLDPVFRDVKIVTVAHTPTYLIDRLNLECEYKLPVYWHRQMERFCLSASDGVIWPSELLRNKLSLELRPEHPRHEVIRNPFEISNELSVETENIRKTKFFIASRLAHWKGIIQAIEAMKVVWDSGIETPLCLFGEDTYYSHHNMQMSSFIKRKYSKYVERGLVDFRGAKPRAEINRTTKDAYAQIHPSFFDNFPYSTLEAIEANQLLAMGACVGTTEVLQPEKCCVNFDPENVEKSAASLLACMEMSDAARDRMLDDAKTVIKTELNYDCILAKREDFFKSLIKTPKKMYFPFLTDGSKKTPLSVKDKPGLLSVVVPYFNMGAYIEETVLSIVNSSYKNIEIIIVDDGSTNELDVEIVQHVAERSGARIIRTTNRGVAEARNTGVEAANGEFVALLDSDDTVAIDYYSRAIEVLINYENVAFVGSWIRDFNEKGDIRVWATYNTELPTQAIFNLTNCQSLVYKKAAFATAGRHDARLKMFLDDWEATLSLMENGFFGVMIPEALFNYRIRDDSIFRSRKAMWISNYQYMVDKHEKIFSAYAVEIIKFLNSNGPNMLYHIPGFLSAYEAQSVASSAGRKKRKKKFRSRLFREFVRLLSPLKRRLSSRLDQGASN